MRIDLLQQRYDQIDLVDEPSFCEFCWRKEGKE